jgi:plastocyanin
MTAIMPTTNINDVEVVEAALRGELNARAVGLPAGRPPVASIVTAARRDRMRRRTYTGTGFVLIAAVIAAATPAVVGAAHGAGVASAAAEGTGPSQLLSMAPRGNLIGDEAFMQAVETRMPGDKVLYANDDGTHTVVVGADTADTAKRSSVEFRTLIGGHGASASHLEVASDDGGFSREAKTYTFVGEFTAEDARVPLLVLGPMDLTGIEYATGVRLTENRGRLVPVRTGVRRVEAVDGVSETEVSGTDALHPSSDSGLYFAVRAKFGNEYVSTSPVVRALPATTAGTIEDPDYDPIRAAIVAKGKVAGITLALRGASGDALADNVALVLSDVANLADVTPSNVATRVAWVGRETPEWDSALVEFDGPGLPAFQAFIRGLAPGVPDGDSPSLAQSFVRPAEPLAQGQIPTTAAAFGGTPEFATVGGGLFERW